jgi:hypothetical protein
VHDLRLDVLSIRHVNAEQKKSEAKRAEEVRQQQRAEWARNTILVRAISAPSLTDPAPSL